MHQHIFKVGWLVTKQYQTTTILYYAFFLPGIILNQLVFWLAAGFLNVSAERTIEWPQKQEIGELKLDFIRLSKNVSPLRFAIISTAPLLVGLFTVAFIANNVLNVPGFLIEMNIGGSLLNFSTALSHFTSAPDFWIWVYLAFAVANTMMPNFANLRAWRIVLFIIAAVIAGFYILGAGDQVIMSNLRGPVTNVLNSLSSVFAIIIGLDIFMVVVLGTLEAIIERITGDSATFENGKMITLRRSELAARRQQALAVRPQQKSQRAASAPSGPPSVYKLNFPIPGAPGKEAVTPSPQIVISQEPKPATPALADSRSGPAVITGTVAEKLPPPSSQPAAASVVPSNPAAPPARPALTTASSASSQFKPSPVPSASSAKPATPGSLMSPLSSEKPSAPIGTSPFERPATPIGTRPTSITTPASATPSTEKPATPMGTIRSTGTSPIVSSSGVRPAPKPVSPFAGSDDLDDENEDAEDEIKYVDDESVQDSQDDEESYEDYDPV
ncbi:MAG: hypothetical protein GC179_02460 [Anaerolineaceae bacterium]|nr:hypothetical protein [Anaerolineaceae bacterium]